MSERNTWPTIILDDCTNSGNAFTEYKAKTPLQERKREESTLPELNSTDGNIYFGLSTQNSEMKRGNKSRNNLSNYTQSLIKEVRKNKINSIQTRNEYPRFTSRSNYNTDTERSKSVLLGREFGMSEKVPSEQTFDNLRKKSYKQDKYNMKRHKRRGKTLNPLAHNHQPDHYGIPINLYKTDKPTRQELLLKISKSYLPKPYSKRNLNTNLTQGATSDKEITDKYFLNKPYLYIYIYTLEICMIMNHWM